MENTIEVQIPQGYEYKKMATPILTDGGGMLQIMLTKKNIKNFDFYVDEYLRSDDCTTNDTLSNWIQPNSVDNLKINLKQSKFEFVPWEVKIGLVKFICKDHGVGLREGLYPKLSDKANNKIYELSRMFPSGFIDSVL